MNHGARSVSVPLLLSLSHPGNSLPGFWNVSQFYALGISLIKPITSSTDSTTST
jgi:hypothetical protein